MEESRILVPKKDTNQGPLLTRTRGSPSNQSSGGKENSPQPEETSEIKGLGRVREAALALERLASVSKDEGKCQPATRGVTKPPLKAVPKSVLSTGEVISGPQEQVGKGEIPSAGKEEKPAEQAELPSKQKREKIREGEAPAAASDDYVEQEAGAGSGAAPLAAPQGSNRDSSVPWAKWKLRPVTGKSKDGDPKFTWGALNTKGGASMEKEGSGAPSDQLVAASVPVGIKDAAKGSAQEESSNSWGKWKLRSVNGQHKEKDQETKGQPVTSVEEGIGNKKGPQASSEKGDGTGAVAGAADAVKNSPREESLAPWQTPKLRPLSSKEESEKGPEAAVTLKEADAKMNLQAAKSRGAAELVAPPVVAALAKETPAQGARLSVKSLMHMWTRQGGPSSNETNRSELAQESMPPDTPQVPPALATDDQEAVSTPVLANASATKDCAEEGQASNEAVSRLSPSAGRSQNLTGASAGEAAQSPNCFFDQGAGLASLAAETEAPLAPTGDEPVSRDAHVPDGANASGLPEPSFFRPKKASWLMMFTPQEVEVAGVPQKAVEGGNEPAANRSLGQAEADWDPVKNKVQTEKLATETDETHPVLETLSLDSVRVNSSLQDGDNLGPCLSPSKVLIDELALPTETPSLLSTPSKQGAPAFSPASEVLRSPTLRPANQVTSALAFFSPQAKQKLTTSEVEPDTALPEVEVEPLLTSALAFFSPHAKGKRELGKTDLRGETVSKSAVKSRFAEEQTTSPGIPSLASASAYFGPSVDRQLAAANAIVTQESVPQLEGNILVNAEKVRVHPGVIVSPPPLSAASFFSPAKAPPPRKEATGYGRVKSGLSGWREGDLLLHTSQTSLFQQSSPSPPHRFSVLEPAAEPLPSNKGPLTVSASSSWMSPESRAEVTPYASAHCSPISLPQSSPGIGQSRKAIWDALGEDVARHVDEGERAVDQPAATLSNKEDVATWQADVAGPEEGSEVVSQQVEEHQRVRTPPYTKASAGFGASREMMLFAITPGKKAVQAPLEAGASMVLEQAPAVTEPVSFAPDDTNGTAAGQQEGRATPESFEVEAPAQGSEFGTGEASLAEAAVDPPLNVPQAPEESEENIAPQTDGIPDLSEIVGRFKTTESSQATTKHGVWAALLGGIKGLVTPPKVTPRKSLKTSLARKSPLATKASRGEAGETGGANVMAESSLSGQEQPTAKSLQAELATVMEYLAAGETPEKLFEHVTGQDLTPGRSSEAPTQQTMDTPPSPANEARVALEEEPPGTPQQQKSMSPRTPPLASQAFVFTAVAPKPQTPASEPVAIEQGQRSDRSTNEPRMFLRSADFYRSSGVKEALEKVARATSSQSRASFFDLPDQTMSGSDNLDTMDPILRTVQGMPGGSSELVNYYDLAQTGPSQESLGVNRLPKEAKKPVDGDGDLHTGAEKLSSPSPWLKDPPITLTRWLKADQEQEAPVRAPVQKAEKVPNWARGSIESVGAFVGTKATTLPVSAFGRTLGDREAAKLKKMSPTSKPVEMRGKLVFSTQRQESGEQRYIWARVEEAESPKEGEIFGANKAGGKWGVTAVRSAKRASPDGGADAGLASKKRGSILTQGSWTANKIPFSQRGRSLSVTTRTSEQRNPLKGGLELARTLSSQRLRMVKEKPDPVVIGRPKSNWSERKWFLENVANEEVDTWQDENVDIDPSEDDVRQKEKSSRQLSTPAPGEEGTLSLRDPTKAPPAAPAEYIQLPATTVDAGLKASLPVLSDAKTLWRPAVAEVDPPSVWGHLSPSELVNNPLHADVDVCRCYVVREQASKMNASTLYRLYTEEGQGRQDRLLLVARHQRHVSRSEFVITDVIEKLGEKERALVRANFMGSKYTAHSVEGPKETKLVEIGYAATAASLSPTFRRMLVSVPVSNGDAVRDFSLVSKMPAYNRDQKRFEISYGGRAKDGMGVQQSVKNFQLVHESAENRTVLLFGKVGKDVFVMDFRHPLNATQAFAVSLSSIDSKLCCAL